MQSNKTFWLIFSALLLTQTLFSQTLWRGLRLPQNDRPRFIRHPLADSQSPGITLQFRYEPEPVKPLLRVIHRGITEANHTASAPEEIFDIGKSTMFLEELSREAASALAATVESETVSSSTVTVGSLTESIAASATTTVSSSTAIVGSYTESIPANNPVNISSLTATIGSYTVSVLASSTTIISSGTTAVGSISADFDSGGF